jgi:hypothetical protein
MKTADTLRAELHVIDRERRAANATFLARAASVRAELAALTPTPEALQELGFTPESIAPPAQPDADGWHPASGIAAPAIVAAEPSTAGAVLPELAPAAEPDSVDVRSDLPILVADRKDFPHARAMHDFISQVFARADAVEKGLAQPIPGEPLFHRVEEWAASSRAVAAKWQDELDEYVTPHLPMTSDFASPADLRALIAKTETDDLAGGDSPMSREWRYRATAIAATWEAAIAASEGPATPERSTSTEENAPAVSATGASSPAA